MLRRIFEKVLKSEPESKVLVVCMENICRSPMAEGALKRQLELAGVGTRVKVESAGVIVSAPRSLPDVRAVSVSQTWNIDIRKVRSRKISTEDFFDYDYILAADQPVLNKLIAIKPANAHAVLSLFLTFAGNNEHADLPDPYFGTRAGFETIMDLIGGAAPSIVDRIVQEKLTPKG
ncbi:low molecular weight protein-tyrosine-phosphatase [Neptunomonas marina]|uniref:protein-tyrosine-phosphatase n=1 Tax=Neptunomonas marina TaxID=1815562 RepID=A0A437Q8D8_9GAMM|nr:low molecular weight protein-tyrosine-phosphatase [Neptunomonas marina]RVU30739.1 low molecular weight phosphotyrosine protein phosphatase [Neptunomonas marina]